MKLLIQEFWKSICSVEVSHLAKVKLPVSEHQDTKTYTGYKGKVPHILVLCTREKSVVNFTVQLLYLLRMSTSAHRTGG